MITDTTERGLESLLVAAMVGKLDVRVAAVALPEEVEEAPPAEDDDADEDAVEKELMAFADGEDKQFVSHPCNTNALVSHKSLLVRHKQPFSVWFIRRSGRDRCIITDTLGITRSD